MPSLLKLDRLSIARGDRVLCQGITYDVKAGDICHVVGENGLGKTTLFMQIVGLLPSEYGQIISQTALYVPHETGVHEALSVRQNLVFLLALYGINPSDDELCEALDKVGLSGYQDVPVAQLSAGQKRRVGLARLWLVSPDVAPLWVLDEPLTALDVVMVSGLCERLADFAHSGGAVILTSHQTVFGATATLDLSLYADGDDDTPNKQTVYVSTQNLTTLGVSVSALLKREWQVKYQGATQWLQPLIVFLLIITLFPLAMGSDPALLVRLAVPMVWIATVLSLVIGSDGLFKTEFDNGTLSQIVASKTVLPLWVVLRVGIHWLFGAGCVAVLSLFAMPLFGLKFIDTLILSVSILVGSPILVMLSAIASSLTLSAKNGAVLVPLIAIPIQLPVLIFATGAVERAMMGLGSLPIFALLLAGSLIAVMVSPWVIAMSLKLSWQS